jgi:drug/metabolite transporter (DMT)-like permease
MTQLPKIILGSTILLIVTIAGDFCIKKAATLKQYTGWQLLLLGGVVNFACAIGWFWIYRSQKFLTVGAILSIGLLALSVLVSQVIFKEKINNWEIFGVVLGFISLAILLKNGNL